MASYVLLLKEFESKDVVIYRFGPNENSMGKIELNKLTRKVSEIEAYQMRILPQNFILIELLKD